MSLSSVIKQAEEVLEEVLRSIRQEYEHPYSVLCETDRKRFVEEEESLREQFKETVESAGSTNWRSLLCLPSPQAAKCLKDAEELRQRVKEDISAKVRTRVTGKSIPPPSSSHGQDAAFNLMGARTPETDTGHPLADGNPEPASTMITSPLNMRCSVPEISELIVYPAVQNDHDYTSDLNEAINTPLETSSDRNRDSSSRRQRRSPPPPPSPRRTPQSSNSNLLSETTTNPGSGSPRRSQSIRRPAPPPPQSRTPRSSINGSFPSPGLLPPNPTMMSSIPEFTQHVDRFVSSIIQQSLSRQGQGGRGLRCSDDYVTNKTNCVDITGSNAEGVTLNNGGTKNTGAVIHKTVLPPRSPQHV